MNKATNLRVMVVCTALALAACGKPKPAAEQPAADAAQATPAPAALPASTAAARTPSAPGATVAILSPADGAVVSSPVKVVFAVQGMSLAPAGDPTPNTGHHHLLVDTPVPADLGQPLPKDDQHIHFGKGQTEGEVTLAPGQHTLILLLGDANHVPHDPPVSSAPVTITVQ
jgi:hypothetical protein